MHTYPIRLEGRLDPGLSRWQWLVKWLLAIPHYVILAFLLLAFAVLTVVAGSSPSRSPGATRGQSSCSMWA